MPIIINHNLCDDADACGGISVCPSKAFYYDYEKMRIAIYKNKCTECLKCTLPDACSVGCIACHLCEKNCPSDAVHVVDNVAYIDQEKCTKCGLCAEKCPKKIIL